jgi:hypothetical protein
MKSLHYFWTSREAFLDSQTLTFIVVLGETHQTLPGNGTHVDKKVMVWLRLTI